MVVNQSMQCVQVQFVSLPSSCTAVGAGMLEFKGIPTNKRAVHHELTWFDKNVFRTALGKGSGCGL